MKTVTAINAQKNQRGWVNVFLDGEFSFSLSLPLVQEVGLKPGQRLSPSEIEELTQENQFRHTLDAALRYLSYRPRSEAELRTRLRRQFDDNLIDRVMLKLKEQQLVDDAAFAQFWKENRESFSPRASRLLKLELRRKGVDWETVDAVTAGVDDEISAYRAAQKKLGAWAKLDYPSFRRRLGAYLKQRGFGYEVTRRTADRLWQEREMVSLESSQTPFGEAGLRK